MEVGPAAMFPMMRRRRQWWLVAAGVGIAVLSGALSWYAYTDHQDAVARNLRSLVRISPNCEITFTPDSSGLVYIFEETRTPPGVSTVANCRPVEPRVRTSGLAFLLPLATDITGYRAISPPHPAWFNPCCSESYDYAGFAGREGVPFELTAGETYTVTVTQVEADVGSDIVAIGSSPGDAKFSGKALQILIWGSVIGLAVAVLGMMLRVTPRARPAVPLTGPGPLAAPGPFTGQSPGPSVGQGPGPPVGQSLGVGGGGFAPPSPTGETRYDLSSWSAQQTASLMGSMSLARIPHRFEGSGLIVPDASRAGADTLIRAVLQDNQPPSR